MAYVYDQDGNIVGSVYDPGTVIRYYVEDGEIYSTKVDPYPQYITAEELDEGLLRNGIIDPYGKLLDSYLPTRLTDNGLGARFIPRWQPLTSYTAGLMVFNPYGQAVVAKTDHVSGSLFNTANWDIASTPGGVEPTSGYEPKINSGTSSQYWRGDKTFQTLDKAAIGLGNVPNIDPTDSSKQTSGTLSVSRLVTALKALGGLTPTTDSIPYFTSSTTASLTTISAFIRTLLGNASASTARTTLDVPSKAEALGYGVQTGVMSAAKITSSVTPTGNATPGSTTAGLVSGLSATVTGEGRPVRVYVNIPSIVRSTGTNELCYVSLIQDSALVTYFPVKQIDGSSPGENLSFSFTTATLSAGVSYQFRVGTSTPGGGSTFTFVTGAQVPAELAVCRG